MVTGAPQLLWTKTSGAQEDVGVDTEGREGQRGSGWISPLPPGCGGEGSWHRDLMHKEKQKSHCQGFPLFHSSAGDRVIFPQWDAFSLLWLFCFFFFFSVMTLDVAMEPKE